MPISKLNMLKDVELFPLQVRQKHPAHITSSGGAPHLRWLCEHMLHLQHRVKIPDLFPVQQLNSLNLISLIRLPQKKKKSFGAPSPTLYHAFGTGGRWNEFVVFRWRFYEQCFMPKRKLFQLN